MSADKPAAVIDCGTGYTKMGYAGNCEPQFIIPTLIANKSHDKSSGGHIRSRAADISDLDFYIGYEAQAHSTNGLASLLTACQWQRSPYPNCQQHN